MTKQQRRDLMLTGVLDIPQQLVDLAQANPKQCKKLFQSLWNNYLSSKSGTSVPFWADQFTSKKAFTKLTMHLSKSKWANIVMDSKRNWGEITMNEEKLLEYVSEDELKEIRMKYKMRKYTPRFSESTNSNSTKQGNLRKDTGLVREGFAKAGNTMYQYDVHTIDANRKVIELNLTKSMDKLGLKYDAFKDNLNYADISKNVLEFILDNPTEVYTTGNSTNDSRGRAISDVLRQVFNPISNKDARACMIIYNPKPMRMSALKDIYLFIAELVGNDFTTMEDKIDIGKLAYEDKTYHSLKANDEKHRKHWHENMWLNRLYNELNRYKYYLENGSESSADVAFRFNVPIELDASASMLQYKGILLNHTPYKTKTNMIGATLDDPWSHADMSREHYKAVATPRLYASSESPQALWRHRELEFTPKMTKAINKDLNSGFLAVADKFKEFIIENVKPKQQMRVKIWNEEFDIVCNRFKSIGEYSQAYNAYDTESNTIKTIYHTHTKQEPDLFQFKRYFVTLLIHNLDSQVADNVCLNDTVEWIVPIHDAFIIEPVDATEVRLTYSSQMEDIHKDKDHILKDYFHSIGIDSKSAGQWGRVVEKCIPLEEKFECGYMALK